MAFFRSHTPIFKDSHGNKIEDSIAEMRMIDINGTKQFVLIRGENKSNPVLLVVHGGPGSPETALFRYYNHELEKYYVVVYWEQRGCGKSYSKEVFKEPLSLEIFIDDACKLTEYLKDYLDKEKVFLLCHSWGTYIGIMAAYKHPELFYAYIGTGQVADMPQGEIESYKFALNCARQVNNIKAIKELEQIGEPKNGAYKCGISGLQTERKWLMYFGGAIYGEKSMNSLMKKVFTAKEYSFIDIYHFILGMTTPARNELSQNQFLQVNLSEIVKEIKIPVYFLLGRHDYQVPSIIAEKYLEYLNAPKKSLIWFEKSAHCSCFEEPDKFNNIMINNILNDIEI